MAVFPDQWFAWAIDAALPVVFTAAPGEWRPNGGGEGNLMGSLVYSMITSVDGYVADEDGDFGWAQPSEEAMESVNADFAEVGTLLYGRRMYEMMEVWETDPAVINQSPKSRDFAEMWSAKDKIVYSTTLMSVSTERTRVHGRFDPQLIRDLKRESDRTITVDGPTLAAEALHHGLVDEIHMLVCPIALGSGQPMLPKRRIELELTHEERFSNGTVQLKYNVGTCSEGPRRLSAVA